MKEKLNNSLSVEELQTKANELEAHIFKLRMQKAINQLANTASIRLARKELARAKTFLTQKGLKGK